MPEHFVARRQRLLAQLQAAGGGVAVVATAPAVLRNGDVHYAYRHDSTFYYLSGIPEPEAVLVLVADGVRPRSLLFCREKAPALELWEGPRLGPQEACEQFGLDDAQPVDALEQAMPALLLDAPALYYLFDDTALAKRARGWLGAVRRNARGSARAPARTCDLARLSDEMRLFKDDSEIALMQQAADLAATAHRSAMRAARPGLFEYQLEAELLHAFRHGGAQAPSFASVVASGANACVLHYEANRAQCRDGELVLIDAGCELGSYASDISRTFPVNGRFSPAQKALYELVLAAQQAALAAIAPGRSFIDGHHAAVRVLAAGMLDLGLLDRNKAGTLDDVLEKRAYQQFYMHGTSHWLGLDVHDVGDYRETPDGVQSAAGGGDERPYRRLAPGMTLTVEPGIYVRPAPGVPEAFWNTGIRIEDDVLVTPTGHRILSAGVPKSVAEIEAWMAQP